ncbi:preprotein translocase subunit SecE [Brevibacterium ihuae]|uniref:preprotein translocase subunit SecE n=1 Tax=Brevibacterium ihuae TaxID=1631743 RepID=UPI000C7936A3|nr:preprotein translocase subunit SecE [Brevibacterium ihuae]
MADTPAKTSGARRERETEQKKRGLLGGILQFFREVVAELKKVVTPTRKELINYTLVVLAFVIVMMLLVTVLDFIFGRLAGFVFGGTPLWPLW